MKLKGIELYNVFEPVIQDVIDLVTQQIEATKTVKANLKSVLLIGGFGESEWTAVQRGALMKGLADYSSKNTKVAITARSARCHYGTESAKEWDGKQHEEDQRIWSAANSRWEVNTYDWFIAKNETVSEKIPKRLHYHTESLCSLKKLDNITITIVECADLEGHGAPVFVGDGEVTTHATLEVPLSKIPTKNLQKRQSENGQEWYIVDFSLKVTRKSAEFEYTLMHNRKSYNSFKANFV
ncbi:MAG: hypothetical protein Q9226_009208, partial [Calogaya cf. arnoldii]